MSNSDVMIQTMPCDRTLSDGAACRLMKGHITPCEFIWGGFTARAVVGSLAGKVVDLDATGETVNHPKHYNKHPSGVECITIVEHMGFNVGNAVKYLWRADEKGSALEDLKKAAWYIQREIERRTKTG